MVNVLAVNFVTSQVPKFMVKKIRFMVNILAVNFGRSRSLWSKRSGLWSIFCPYTSGRPEVYGQEDQVYGQYFARTLRDVPKFMVKKIKFMVNILAVNFGHPEVYGQEDQVYGQYS
jgi:hypothetical protein